MECQLEQGIRSQVAVAFDHCDDSDGEKIVGSVDYLYIVKVIKGK